MSGITSAALSSSIASATQLTGAGTGSTSQGSSSTGLTEQDFIKLLVAQLQNQNPTAPTNPQDLANEFSDMAMVSGITGLGQQVSQIQARAAPAQLAQAAGLIGKTVAVQGNTLSPVTSGGAQGAFSLSGTATQAMVSIFNSAGNPVGSVPVQTPVDGLNVFQWSGGNAGQTYHFSVAAVTATGAAVPATSYAAAQVSAVDLSQSPPAVSLAGSPATVPLSNIVGLLGG